MIAMFRLMVFGFLFLSVIYLLIWLYSRSVRREKLENEFDNEVKTGDRDAYIKEGMEKYESGIRKKLILLVYIVPTIIVVATLFITNNN